ncbi:transporter substrate-binding domain-containing protein [Terasakiella sp. SH-1]|uniref:substrate-binding periplasmic protein n=1 Tax=Terasakiella sp. SH-1 TaxID=2560057 RepID=UPI0010735629|nr:transporter substrate-binding domain-containing protein [Terasakiella sp. SH-1]
MRPLILAALLLSLLVFTSPSSAQDEFADITVVTSSFKPYSYIYNGTPRGISVAQAQRIFKELDFDPQIHVTTWPNAYKRALKRPKTLIFSMIRTPEREDKFHWIGKIAAIEAFLFKKKGNEAVQLATLEEGLAYKTGALSKDAKGKHLIDQGYKIWPISSQNSGVKMVLSGRLDMIPADINSLNQSLKELSQPKDALVPVLKLKKVSKPVYIAFSKDTPQELVERFRAAYKKAFSQ